MQNVKTRDFENKLKRNGFYPVHGRGKGSHAVYERIHGTKTESLSVPVSSNEINGCMVKRLTKKYGLF